MICINFKNKSLPRSRSSGFTLLEMIVSLGIFSIVAVIAVGSLVRITGLNRQAQTLQSAMNNINYILESMSREMRFGSNFNCTTSASWSHGGLTALGCSNGSGEKGILFKSAKIGSPIVGSYPNGCQLVIGYWFKQNGGAGGPWSVLKSQQNRCDDSLTLNSGTPLIDEGNVTLTNVEFGVQLGDRGYSWASVRLKGYAGTKATERNDFDIRTGISQRIADLP
jgi:prepilin-type N-terminal cleavage/methylation domain-containing protein